MFTQRRTAMMESISVRTRFAETVLCIVACCTISLPSHASARVTPDDPLPTKVLTCGGSVITAIGPRLSGDADLTMGYSVSFRNGGQTVGNTTPAAVRKSKVGDHVFICLVNLPKDCPSKYSYKRVYTVTNLRTLQSWSDGNDTHDYCAAPGTSSQ